MEIESGVEILARGAHWQLAYNNSQLSVRFFCTRCHHRISLRGRGGKLPTWCHFRSRLACSSRCSFCPCSDAVPPSLAEKQKAFERLEYVKLHKLDKVKNYDKNRE